MQQQQQESILPGQVPSVVDEFWVDGVVQPSGTYNSASGLTTSNGDPLISGGGTLTRLPAAGAPDAGDLDVGQTLARRIRLGSTVPRILFHVQRLPLQIRPLDHVTVDELADWIIQGRNDYRLLDVRDAAAYAEYHIPTAESVKLSELADYPLFRNETIVLYSDGGMHSAQAWFLLQARGYSGARILLYGLEEWKDRILFPALPADAGPREQADFARRSRVSRFFGGTPLSGVEAAAERPQVAMPEAPQAAAPVVSRKRKRKEGC